MTAGQSNTIFRRIRKSETGELEVLCQADTYWQQYFTEHQAWLDKAIADVLSKDRVVFGAFAPRAAHGNHATVLVACVFLKLSKFDNSIELKNLLLPSYDFQNDSDLVRDTKLLIDSAIRFCEVRNILKIEIELPQEEHLLISLFLSLNFKIVALRERYSAGNMVCTLERSIGETYFGDPFDRLKLAYWLLRCYMPCEVVGKVANDGRIRMSFEGKGLTKAFSDKGAPGRGKLIKGDLWLLNDEEGAAQDAQFIFEDQEMKPLTLIMTDYELDDELKQSYISKGMISFDKKELLEIAGKEESSLYIPINASDIGGIVTVLEQEQVIDYAKKGSLTYYLLSGLHNGLSLPEGNTSDNERAQVLAIYCPSWNGLGPGIAGLGIISNIRHPKFKTLMTEKRPADSALSKEDLSFYQTYSSDERIGELKVSKLVLFERPLPIASTDWLEDDRVRDYLENEIVENACNSVYLDQTSVSHLRRLARTYGSYYKEEEQPGQPAPEKTFKIGLSFPGSQRSFVKKVADILVEKYGRNKIFYDHHFQGKLARRSLDTYLGNIYRNECDLVVAFFSKDYQTQPWCRLEWRYILDILFSADLDDLLMPLKFEDVEIPGMLGRDSTLDISQMSAADVAQLIIDRLE